MDAVREESEQLKREVELLRRRLELYKNLQIVINGELGGGRKVGWGGRKVGWGG